MDDFPRLHARTQRFTLGRPRAIEVTQDGSAVWFLASDAGDDPVHHLWRHDVAAAVTAKVVDARRLDVDPDTLTAAERARRERAREGGGGITSFTTAAGGDVVAFAVGGVAFVADRAGTVVTVESDGPAHDPRPSPDGHRLAMVVGRSVHVAGVPIEQPGGGEPVRLVGDAAVAVEVVGPDDREPDTVSWGLAEFVAAEEMGRGRGFWWAPDGTSLLVARVDESDVARAWLSDPVHPRTSPRSHRYPFAGTMNATVDLHLVDLDTADVPTAGVGGDGSSAAGVVTGRQPRPVGGDRDHYMTAVSWSADGPALVTWQDRAQQTMTVTTLDVDTATLSTRRSITGRPWVELVPGSPAWAGDALVTVEACMDMGPEGTHAVVVDGEPVSPPGLQVRSVEEVTAARVEVRCSREDATSIEVVAIDLASGAITDVAGGAGVHAVERGGDTLVVTSTTLEQAPTVTVRTPTGDVDLPDRSLDVPSGPPVRLLTLGDDALRAGLVTPDGPGPFPVLLDPYGGPHAQRVLRARTTWSVAQWFATRGFAVLVTDNRGAPGRSPAFEHAVAGDFADGVLADQVAALQAAAALDDRLDLDRVGIRGWSFGGYLAALAALRRPDVFHAAIVGAPVTDWQLYDTHYTERYLGHPDDQPDAYLASSLVDQAGELVGAISTDRPVPMLVIHGLVDDNVVVAHSLRLSGALLAAGHPHRFLPLSGVTHMTPQEVVAANLLTSQLAFLRETMTG